MAHCPRCKSDSNHRMRRKGIYKMIPQTRAYSCDKCNAYYIWFKLIGAAVSVRK